MKRAGGMSRDRMCAEDAIDKIDRHGIRSMQQPSIAGSALWRWRRGAVHEERNCDRAARADFNTTPRTDSCEGMARFCPPSAGSLRTMSTRMASSGRLTYW